jgi:hypothetical protein
LGQVSFLDKSDRWTDYVNSVQTENELATLQHRLWLPSTAVVSSMLTRKQPRRMTVVHSISRAVERFGRGGPEHPRPVMVQPEMEEAGARVSDQGMEDQPGNCGEKRVGRMVLLAGTHEGLFGPLVELKPKGLGE